ncbi:MAG: polyphosphate polymerase domain-containing protein [Bacteroidales bacterium]|nr:polyphosphate polymerase domain-containing protein [Bacteroidales bacterium]MBN2820213.1 polyphosphate polymerase domain-containing protein [Bacteroidales bacterium]
MREDTLLNDFNRISLFEMDDVKLMNRIDTKYVIRRDVLQDILKDLSEHYFVLEIQDKRSFPYISLYYDTHDNFMYKSHHNGKLNRYKIRFRKYVTSDSTFLEIKRKVKGTLTLKKRIEVPSIEDVLSIDSSEFIKKYTGFDNKDLEAKIFTNFDRITLVNKDFTERVTIDRNLQFLTQSDKCSVLKNTVIIEVKRDFRVKRTQLIDILKKYRVQPSGMSKYCIGRAILHPELKSNNFKQKILTLNKFENASFHYRIVNERVS